MFSFHKPKTYRSSDGCCICKAKSSSSRFTDSKKYENDFADCFRIEERRAGEICNACVLLVKRWKKLPSGSKRHWHHVVDARAGPGSKSLTRVKSRLNQRLEHFSKYKHKKLPSKRAPSRLFARSPSLISDDNIIVSDEESSVSSSESGSEYQSKRRQRRVSVSPLLDLSYWKTKHVCCGIIFVGEFGETILDPKLIRGCEKCIPNYSRTPSETSSIKDSLDRQTSSGSTVESDNEHAE